MARNQEKAMSTLNRWIDQKRLIDSSGQSLSSTARFPSECRSVKECEVSRSQIVRRLSSLISQIQDSTLGEQRVRDLNDEINKLFRSKYAWETQILKLGGPDYRATSAGLTVSEGIEIPGQGGYKYYGAAKDLPGVRELLEAVPVVEAPRKSRSELLGSLRADYYGWQDEDNELLPDEAEAEARCRAGDHEDVDPDAFYGMGDTVSDEILHLLEGSMLEYDQTEIDRMLVAKKKEFLLNTFLNGSKGSSQGTGPRDLEYQARSEDRSSVDVHIVET